MISIWTWFWRREVVQVTAAEAKSIEENYQAALRRLRCATEDLRREKVGSLSELDRKIRSSDHLMHEAIVGSKT